MIFSEQVEDVTQDADAVAAVRGGDAERYRELVERHERRVYAVAWSRLGDAALAEEAAQEAFIRGYRRLWLLGDGAKFSAWIATIARNAAVNLGLRHRRELSKRERWGLEQPSATPPGETEPGEVCPPETLRQALAELPAAHRECLVLFYLEGKSGTEAAATLGVSEVALRVRLHRARAVLRERLEERLAESLEQLRPAKALAPAIMTAVLAASTSKSAAAGAGAGALGAFAKFGPVKFLLSAMPAVALLPGLLLNWVVMRLELRNFRDREGFRARLFRENWRRTIIGFAVMMLAIYLGLPLFHKVASWESFYLGLAGLSVVTSAIMAGPLAVIRNRYFISLFVANVSLGVFCLAVGLGWIPAGWIAYFMTAQILATTWFYGERPGRTDYNLFLRASEGMLKSPSSVAPEPVYRASCDQNDLLAFARFLGARWLVNGARRTEDGLMLRLAPANASPWALTRSFAFLFHRMASSRLSVKRDGTVTAVLRDNDRRVLRRLRDGDLPPDQQLEYQVAAAVESAWGSFRTGDVAAAERVLGQTAESEVFVQPQAKSASTRTLRAFIIILAVLMVYEQVKINGILGQFGGSGLAGSLHDISAGNLRLALSDLAKATTEQDRYYALGRAAKECFVAGRITEARAHAEELMALIPKYPAYQGDAIQDANLVLGRLAAREGRIKAAKEYLIQAGKSPGSPSMNSFGPNMTLAKDLIEKGETTVALQYFALCRKFWKMGGEKLDQWTDDVIRSRTPDFGANLLY
jgi:RNA polymerase sigma factor (sigma-70 family)